MADDTRQIVLPLQLMAHVHVGDTFHFHGQRERFRVVATIYETGMVVIERDFAGPSYSEWIQGRAGVKRGG